MARKPTSSRPSGRALTTRVKTAKRRKTSSTRWLQRQLNDPYVAEARRRGYRSRAAFKAAPDGREAGIAAPRHEGGRSGRRAGRLVPGSRRRRSGRRPAAGASSRSTIWRWIRCPGSRSCCWTSPTKTAPDRLRTALDGPADLVMSDMAAPTVGHPPTDHLRIMGLAELAYDFARDVLAPGGSFVCKVFSGGAEKSLLEQLKRDFDKVRHVKPPASRSDFGGDLRRRDGVPAAGAECEAHRPGPWQEGGRGRRPPRRPRRTAAPSRSRCRRRGSGRRRRRRAGGRSALAPARPRTPAAIGRSSSADRAAVARASRSRTLKRWQCASGSPLIGRHTSSRAVDQPDRLSAGDAPDQGVVALAERLAIARAGIGQHAQQMVRAEFDRHRSPSARAPPPAGTGIIASSIRDDAARTAVPISTASSFVAGSRPSSRSGAKGATAEDGGGDMGTPGRAALEPKSAKRRRLRPIG